MSSLDIYYKVVYSTPSGLQSAVFNIDSDIVLPEYKKYIIKYRTQRWTNPVLKNSKIFIFTTFGAALSFLEKENRFQNNKLHIYECLAQNPIPATYITSLNNIEKFWTQKSHIEIYNTISPLGSLFCDSVYLLKRVA